MGAVELVKSVARLPRDEELPYVNANNKSRITIHSVTLPHGPILFSRRKKGQHSRTCVLETISERMIRRAAAQIVKHEAFTMEALLKGSGNVRSVFEALLAHLPDMYVCYPARCLNGVHENVKHLYWNPDKLHKIGVITETDEIKGVMEKPAVRSQIAAAAHIRKHPASNFEKLRLHQQIQVKLFEIGAAKRFSVWIAENDHNIRLDRRLISANAAAVKHLSKVPIMQPFAQAQKAAKHLDAVFFREDGFIPAVVEIEQSTGILPGLTRMETFRQRMQGVFANRGSGGTSFVICAEDDKRDEVIRKASSPQFEHLAPRFLPYSQVDLIWSLCMDGRQSALTDHLFEIFSDDCRKFAPA